MARHSISLLAGGAVLLSALTASAQIPQSRPERPYRGVYASGTERSEQVLAINGSAGSGYDTSVSMGEAEAGFGGVATPNQRGTVGAMYNQFNGGLSYSASLERFSAGASLSSTVRQYPTLDVSRSATHAASGGASLSVATNTRITGNVAASYQAQRTFAPFPVSGDPALGEILTPGQDYGGARGSYHTYTTQAGLTQQLSRRASFSVTYDRQRGESANGVDDLTRQTGAVRFTRSFTRNLGLRLGYGYTDAAYGVVGRTYQNHNLDTGLEFNRYLSSSRRTRLSFSTGAAATRQGEADRFDVTGSATLTREIGRTWNTNITYRRDSGFDEAVLAPLFYDGLNVGVNGLITRSLSFNSGIGASLGHVGIRSADQSANANRYDTWTAFAGVNRALTRNLAIGVNYTFYRYSFEADAAPTTFLRPETNRHSINVTLNAWAPLFQHGRKTNAPR